MRRGLLRGTFFGLIAALIVWTILAAMGALTLFVLNTLFLSEPLDFRTRNLIAAMLFNVMLAWLGAGPWFVIGLKSGNNPSV